MQLPSNTTDRPTPAGEPSPLERLLECLQQLREVLQAGEGRLLLTEREAAVLLSVSKRTLWQLARDGQIHAVKIGGSKRYCVIDLMEFVERLRGQRNGRPAPGRGPAEVVDQTGTDGPGEA